MNSRRILIGAALVWPILVLAAGCKKDQPVVVLDSGPPPAAIDAAPADLTPLDTLDAGDDAADAADAAKKAVGDGLTTSQRRAKQCCTALRSQAKAMGSSPESAMLVGIAAQCDAIALNLGPSKGPQAPELEPIRAILRGKPTLPALCQGL